MLVLVMRLPLVRTEDIDEPPAFVAIVVVGVLLLGGTPVVAPVVETLVVVDAAAAAAVDVSIPRAGAARMRSRTSRGTSAWSVAVSTTPLVVCSRAVG